MSQSSDAALDAMHDNDDDWQNYCDGQGQWMFEHEMMDGEIQGIDASTNSLDPSEVLASDPEYTAWLDRCDREYAVLTFDPFA